MKTFLSVLVLIGLALSGFAQSQGVSQRATNGIAFGRMVAQSYIAATNTATTNTFAGKLQQGSGTTASGMSASAFGLNSRSLGTASFVTGVGNSSTGSGSLTSGSSNNIQNSAPYSLASGSGNRALDPSTFVTGSSNIVAGSNSFVSGLNITMEANSPNSFIAGQGVSILDGASNNFVWNGNPSTPLQITSDTTNAFTVVAPGGIFLNGNRFTNGGVSVMNSNQFTTNTVGAPIVGNVNLGGATNNASGDLGVNGVLGAATANAGALTVAGNATVNGTLSSSTSTSGVFTVTSSIIAPFTNTYAWFNANGVMRATNNGNGLTNIIVSQLTNIGALSGITLDTDGRILIKPGSTPTNGYEYVDVPVTTATASLAGDSFGLRTLFTVNSTNVSYHSAALFGEALIASGNSLNSSQYLAGLYGYLDHRGTGNIVDGYGVIGAITINGNGTITEANAFRSSINQVTGTGNSLNVRHYYAPPFQNASGAKKPDYLDGFYVADQGVDGGLATNVYAFRSGGNTKILFTGPTAVGSLSSAGTIIATNGNTDATTNLTGMIQTAGGISATKSVWVGKQLILDPTGSTSAIGISFDPSTFIYRFGAGNIAFTGNTYFDGDVRPKTTATYDIGTSSSKFRNATFSATVIGFSLRASDIITTNGIASYKNATAANTSITVGASPFNYTNSTGVTIFVDIDANGSTTTVGRNGTTVFSALVNGDHEMILKNGGYLTVTYSIATPIMGYTEN